MRRVLARLRAQYDYVVLDAAPLLPVADAVILSRAVDGALVVANVTKVRRHQLAQSLASLAQVSARTLGVVLNQVQRNDPAYGYEPRLDALEEMAVESELRGPTVVTSPQTAEIARASRNGGPSVAGRPAVPAGASARPQGGRPGRDGR
jgi:Mrp family chromosome partitioning ATPase